MVPLVSPLVPALHCSSPPPRIRTTPPPPPPAPATPAHTAFSLSDYQGGHEGLADTDKSREQLYTEAKEILALVGSSGGQDPAAPRRPPSLQELPESPSSTAPRRPPRSKHDHSLGGGGGEEAAQPQPSAEAASRLLIG